MLMLQPEVARSSVAGEARTTPVSCVQLRVRVNRAMAVCARFSSQLGLAKAPANLEELLEQARSSQLRLADELWGVAREAFGQLIRLRQHGAAPTGASELIASLQEHAVAGSLAHREAEKALQAEEEGDGEE